MLNGIPGCISPELMSVMMRMGHSDGLCLADADFPADTFGARVIRADGIGMTELLDAVLRFFPLDHMSDSPVTMMDAVIPPRPAVWSNFAKQIRRHDSSIGEVSFAERFDFYKKAQGCFAVVITGEADGNIILKKGVVTG